MNNTKKYKTGITLTLIVFGILVIVSLLRLLPAINVAKDAAAKKTLTTEENTNTYQGWQFPEIQQKLKELHWLEEQLLLAKSDSLTLGINLLDSVVRVQLKGNVLLEAEILKQYPGKFISSPDFPAYLNLAATSKIVSEKSSIPKKPIKNVKAPKNENEVTGHTPDTIPVPPLVWKFQLDNEMEVVISGVTLNNDSTQFFPDRYLVKYSFEKMKSNLYPKTYLPVLYIWLDDKDAKAIYRAIPEMGKVVLKI